MRLKDKVAIVTGSGRGIGEGIVLRFAEEGAKIIVNDVNEADAKAVVDKIKAKGARRLPSWAPWPIVRWFRRWWIRPSKNSERLILS